MAGKKSKKNKQSEGAVLTPPTSEQATPSKRTSRMEVEGEEELKVYLPGMELAEGEELEVDPSAYVMLHQLHGEWPCLSFDIVMDGVREERTTFPMSGYLVTGTQADEKNQNQLLLLRYTNLHKTLVKDEQEEEEASEDEESSDGEEEASETTDGRKDPRHYCISIPHDGGVNRIRSTNIRNSEGSLQQTLTATWSETGKVNIWDLRDSFIELAKISPDAPSSLIKKTGLKAMHTVTKHKTEGFALDWSSLASGRLLSGDCNGSIFLTELREGGQLETAPKPFTSHTGSVEDIQWSPSEPTVFASSSVDQTVRLWDIRMPSTQAALMARLHTSDINVIHWNRRTNWMLASGADDGSFGIWDLRKFATNSPQAASTLAIPLNSFKWHQEAITSVQWNPHDDSVLAVAGADDQVTIWDLSAEASEQPVMVGEKAVPPQLLFIHQGQQHIKEVSWHPQLSGVLVSTSASGFNIFKTISV